MTVLSSYSGLAFNRANKNHLIRCDLNNFDETKTIIQDVKVEIFVKKLHFSSRK